MHKKILIYCGESHGESEKTGVPYHVYKFMQLMYDEQMNKVISKYIDLFAPRAVPDTKQIDFGAVVKLSFVDSEEIGAKPILVGISVEEGCPYLDLLVE